jgi:hypothetical protein
MRNLLTFSRVKTSLTKPTACMKILFCLPIVLIPYPAARTAYPRKNFNGCSHSVWTASAIVMIDWGSFYLGAYLSDHL